MSEGRGSIWEGLAWCWGLNVLELSTGFGLGSLGVIAIVAIGLVQLVYVLPLFWRWKKKGKTDTIKGLTIAASITALLNATCWGLLARIG